MGFQVITATSMFLNYLGIRLWSVWPGWAPEVSPPGQLPAPRIPQAGPPGGPAIMACGRLSVPGTWVPLSSTVGLDSDPRREIGPGLGGRDALIRP